HAPFGIPRRLEFPESLHDIGPEHHRQKFGPALAITMFARKRSAMPHNRMGNLSHEVAIVLDALGCLWIKRDARMDAAIAEMPEESAGVIVFIEQLVKVAQIVA